MITHPRENILLLFNSPTEADGVDLVSSSTAVQLHDMLDHANVDHLVQVEARCLAT